jgi:Type II site-specific deoxyribonuclease
MSGYTGVVGVSGEDELLKKILALSESQREWITSLIDRFAHALEASALADSDIASEQFLREFGDTLRIHHSLSAEPFTKDKFEHALVRVMNRLGRQAELSNRGNRGHDLTIDETRFSLKTQADRSMKVGTLHISKFMELGRGAWEDEEDLASLRDEFLRHMQAYDRILSLRAFRPGAFDGSQRWVYELVEIPKPLFELASTGTIVMQHGSRQNPKPGYCTVTDKLGAVLYQLYFDGGTERKLQIKSIRKDRCVVHATWSFAVAT